MTISGGAGADIHEVGLNTMLTGFSVGRSEETNTTVSYETQTHKRLKRTVLIRTKDKAFIKFTKQLFKQNLNGEK